MKKFFLALMLLSPLIVRGQGCPSGSVALPTGRCGSQIDANDMRQADYDAETAERLRVANAPRWEDRYGAIAVDLKTGSYGWSSNAKSKMRAAKAAIEDCGGGGCEIQSDGRNTCLATAWGGGVRSYSAETDLKIAESVVMDKCKNNGTGAVCKLDFSACSLPVRIR